eukprot:834048-Amorphochlora_amoeboformis.AAC.2
MAKAAGLGALLASKSIGNPSACGPNVPSTPFVRSMPCAMEWGPGPRNLKRAQRAFGRSGGLATQSELVDGLRVRDAPVRPGSKLRKRIRRVTNRQRTLKGLKLGGLPVIDGSIGVIRGRGPFFPVFKKLPRSKGLLGIVGG